MPMLIVFAMNNISRCYLLQVFEENSIQPFIDVTLLEGGGLDLRRDDASLRLECDAVGSNVCDRLDSDAKSSL